MREMILRMNSGGTREFEEIIESNDRRLEVLIAASNSIKLCKKLASVMTIMRNNEVNIDFRSLFVDIVYWDKKIQLKWASHFYRGEKDVSDTDNN